MGLRFVSIALAMSGLIAGSSELVLAADVSATKDVPVKAKPAPPLLFPIFFVNENRLTYGYQPTAAQPGVTAKTARQVFAFTHFDVWAYGTNYANIGIYKSDGRDPAAPCKAFDRGCAGMTGAFGTIRSTFGFNELFDTKLFSQGPLRSVSFLVGADAVVENISQAPAGLSGVAGIQFAFDLPYKGYINVSPVAVKSQLHDAYVTPAFTGGLGPTDGMRYYDLTWGLEVNYYMDLGFLPDYLPFAISGRAKWVGPLGTGLDPKVTVVPSRTQSIASEPIRLTLDASKLMWGARYSHLLDVFVAYQYWQNKYGNRLDTRNCIAPFKGSCTESTLFTGVSVKF